MQLFDNEFIGVDETSIQALTQEHAPSSDVLPIPIRAASSSFTKACLFTLITYSKNFQESAFCQNIVRILSKKFPYKIIMIDEDSSITDRYTVSTSSFTNASTDSYAVICDLVTIHVSSDQIKRVQFTLMSEIVSDLPLYLLMKDTPAVPYPFFDSLLQYVTKIIYECSSYIAHLSEPLSYSDPKSFIDLHWIKLKPWREAFHEIFNDQIKFSQLQNVSSITLRYVDTLLSSSSPSSSSSTSPLAIQSLYLQAWLANILGWKIDNDELHKNSSHSEIIYTYNGKKVVVNILPFVVHFVEDGSVFSIEIKDAIGTHYLISYENDDQHIVVHSSSLDRCKMPFVLFVKSFNKGHLLGSELFAKSSHSGRYSSMLHTLCHYSK